MEKTEEDPKKEEEPKKSKKKKKKKKKKKTGPKYGAPIIKKGDDYYDKSADKKIHNWENWSDKNDISFDAKETKRDDCTLYFTKCKNTTITVTGKTTRIALLKCSGCTLNTNDFIINKVEVTSCQDVTVKVAKNAPILHVSKSSNTKIEMTKLCAAGGDDVSPTDLLTEESTGTTTVVDKASFDSHYQICSTFNENDNSFTDSVLAEAIEIKKQGDVPTKEDTNFKTGDDNVFYMNWDGSSKMDITEEKVKSLYIGNCSNAGGIFEGTIDGGELTFEGCVKTTVQVTEKCDKVNIIGCKNLSLGLSKGVGAVSITGSASTSIVLNEKFGKGLKIYSDTSNLTTIRVDGGTEDDPTSKEHGVNEQIHSKFDDSKQAWVHTIEKK